MLDRPSRWTADPYSVIAARRLSAELGLSPTAAALLVRRGFGDPRAARAFLAAEERHDPGSMDGVPAACKLILGHVERGSRIVVFGDYDVDGVCSTAMMVRTLRLLGVDPGWRLPSRAEDGYGLSPGAVERLRADGAQLVVTVDCGITAVDEVAMAHDAGMEVLITDHHRPDERLPACPVVHPALGGYPFPELCASGVVLKLSEALLGAAGRDPSGAEADLDLAALATVCDLVPLRGENRRIVREGVRAMSRAPRPGLRALMGVASVEPSEVSASALGFRLGPRINAAGRLSRADAALELVMADDEARADAIAQELDGLNHDRREAEQRILWEADALCPPQAAQAAIVVAGEGWHPGVVGIVASRLTERWGRPCVVVALEGDGGKGSGRSCAGYDLHSGLSACSEHLRRFGGHKMAAGLELARESVGAFRTALAAHAGAALAPEDLVPVENVDAVVPAGALGLELAEELERLGPFGAGNREPTLLVPAARVEAVAAMGQDGKHARFTLSAGGARARTVAFGSSARALASVAGDGPQDVALRLERNRWKGAVEPRAVLRALCPTRPGRVRGLGEDEPFWDRAERELTLDLGPRPASAARVVGELRDRRHEGFAGVLGDLLSSGETALVTVADVPRRRASLEELVAGLAPDGLAVASWSALASHGELANGFDHLVAFDPPPGGQVDPLLRVAPLVHAAWGAAEVDFALTVWRAELELRPALTDAWRALRAAEGPGIAALEAALRGSGRFPRSAECCGRMTRVLREAGLLEIAEGRESWRLIDDGGHVELESSLAYLAYRRRLAAIEAALVPERDAQRAAA